MDHPIHVDAPHACHRRRVILRHAQEMERLAWQIHDVLAQRGDHAGVTEIRTRMHGAKTAQLAPAASAAEASGRRVPP